MLSLTEVVKKYNLRTKKSLGQNFLLNESLTDKIVGFAGDLKDKRVMEIGPGPGGLTRSILKQSPEKLVIIDMDERCIEALKELQQEPGYENKLELVHGDALLINETDYLEPKIKLISNLPYNIGTVLLFKWLDKIEIFESLTLMFQKEVAERICAKPRTKDYGRVSIMAQFLCETKKHFDVKPTAFVPPPKVMSSVISLYPREKLPVDGVDLSKLSRLCKLLFGNRRKVIRSTLKNVSVNGKEVLEKLGISDTKRPEELTVEDFAKISKEIVFK